MSTRTALLLLLFGCASAPPVPIQVKPESSRVGLSVKVINSMMVPVTCKADASQLRYA